jgi:hypothetical protein
VTRTEKGLADCLICGREIDGVEAAIGEHEPGLKTTYVPFVEDLRTSGFGLMHLKCFAEQRGIEALVDVVHEHDRRSRDEFWDLIDRIERLEKASPGDEGTGASNSEHLLP